MSRSVGCVQNRIEESRAHFEEELSLFRKLFQGGPGKYAGDVARVEVSPEELAKKVPSR